MRTATQTLRVGECEAASTFKRAGFTMIEVLLALGLLSILIVALVRLLDTSLTILDRTEVARDLQEMSSSVLDLVAEDVYALEVGPRGDMVGDTMYYGRGAGREPTASAVVADLCDVARAMHANRPRLVPPMPSLENGLPLGDPSLELSRFYLRVEVSDQPGVRAQVTQRLGEHGVSIASVVQREQTTRDRVAVLIVTQPVPTHEFRAALDELRALDIVTGDVVHLPIEDLK